ncbi:PD-(D/E)XK nuclease-like domain-containing protein [Commensalibacter communis]|nr:PD-(D/E)XK nuclease-like domain-containing protein [Commensalibacter communis]CAI3933951.1 unnamed protein product [Commensalibacter communis]CAI3942271.1 unnamed protein product [Commensalibacter communis]CAI3944259.1 unnamed protein product [Commensalibacter communis]CAI3944394.1 unnamed protein product [Commensalibacter communis]
MVNYPSNFEITEADIYYDMPASIYHSDPCPTPSLSNSLIRDLLDKSPYHAAWKHPRFITPSKSEKEPTQAMIMGTVLHNLILNKGNDICIIRYDDYRNPKANKLKKEAFSANKTPILEKYFDNIYECAETALIKLKFHVISDAFFSESDNEVVMSWQEGNIWCRSMIDKLPKNPTYPIFDIKGTNCSGSPFEWQNKLMTTYRTQGVFYERGLEKLTGQKRPATHFVVIEMFEPFEVSVFTIDNQLQELAEQEIERAIKLWEVTIQKDDLDGYTNEIICVEPKPWVIRQIEEQNYYYEAMGV